MSRRSPGIVRRLVDVCIARYVELLHHEIDGGEVETLPGIREWSTALAADRRALVGLLTGNVLEGARLKLEPTGLYSLFKVGAYGSDSALRAELPAVAVARAEALTGRRYAGKDIVIIGDTPADVECGAALGVTSIAVATGRHSMEELEAHGPGPPLRRSLRLARRLRGHPGLTGRGARGSPQRLSPSLRGLRRLRLRPARRRERSEIDLRRLARRKLRDLLAGHWSKRETKHAVAGREDHAIGARHAADDGEPVGVTGRGPRQT